MMVSARQNRNDAGKATENVPPTEKDLTMFRVQKVRAAAIGLLAAVLLAGCSAGPEAETTPGQDPADTPKTQTQPEQRQVRGVEVIDPLTVVVTPTEEDDEFFGEELVVHINDIAAPVEGECGFDEAIALSNAAIVDAHWFLDYSSVEDGIYIDDQGEHHGFLNSRGATYGQTMVTAGMAYVPSDVEDSYLASYESDPKAASAGLWATCSDFGA